MDATSGRIEGGSLEDGLRLFDRDFRREILDLKPLLPILNPLEAHVVESVLGTAEGGETVT